ncbi:hypothetical protein [Actinokineospora inagensis]|uniref:hypothetical protein n=1 Tax=Actinokineospora inagensis TaxID=103730 RepID=UPI0012F8B61C|nr:hypothetical protein [Actinokineospora inagensis]
MGRHQLATWDKAGQRVKDSAHLHSVPDLVRYLVAHELPERFVDVEFSATVYRHRMWAPWLVDIQVHGATVREDDDPNFLDILAHQVRHDVGQHDAVHHGIHRFGAVEVLVLAPGEPHRFRPGYVRVRRFYWGHLARGCWVLVRHLVGWWR